VSDALERLRDVVAVPQGEHSQVDAAARLRIGGLILQVENEELDATARRLVAALPADDLAAIVADWLGAQIAI
jgi:carbon monoxide dehydrogenase subunit G